MEEEEEEMLKMEVIVVKKVGGELRPICAVLLKILHVRNLTSNLTSQFW